MYLFSMWSAKVYGGGSDSLNDSDRFLPAAVRRSGEGPDVVALLNRRGSFLQGDLGRLDEAGGQASAKL